MRVIVVIISAVKNQKLLKKQYLLQCSAYWSWRALALSKDERYQLTAIFRALLERWVTGDEGGKTLKSYSRCYNSGNRTMCNEKKSSTRISYSFCIGRKKTVINSNKNRPLFKHLGIVWQKTVDIHFLCSIFYNPLAKWGPLQLAFFDIFYWYLVCDSRQQKF